MNNKEFNKRKREIENLMENVLAFRDYDIFKDTSYDSMSRQYRDVKVLWNPSDRQIKNAVKKFSSQSPGHTYGSFDIFLGDKPKSKRVKEVYSSSSQVYHLWANQSQASARQGGRMTRAFFEGQSCYSYGRHYEVGRIMEYKGVKVACINDRGYSHTTAKHIREAKYAVRDLMPVVTNADFNVYAGLISMQDAIVDDLMNHFSRTKFWQGSIRKLQAQKSGYSDFDDVHEFNKTCTALKHPELTIDIDQEFVDLMNDYILERLDRQKTLDAGADARRAKRQAEQLKKNKVDVQRWRAGEINATSFISSLSPQILRVSKDNSVVRTSRGAEVPMKDALLLLRRLNNGKVKSGTKIGSFKLDSVKDGIIKIGCHTIALSEANQVLKIGEYERNFELIVNEEKTND